MGDQLERLELAVKRYAKGDKRGGQFAPGQGGGDRKPTDPAGGPPGKDKKRLAPLGAEVLAAMKEAAIRGGLKGKDLADAIEEMRDHYRKTGQVQMPDRMRAAVKKGRPEQFGRLKRETRQEAAQRKKSNRRVPIPKEKT